jgi:phosphatidyl-myo-inositol dimannoside synthase
VWHLHLLKLLPLLDRSAARVIVFLHGIEAWRRHDRLTQRLLKRVDLFLSNSDFTWDRFAARNPRLKDATHRTVHLGIGTPLSGPTPEPSTAAVLIVSRLDGGEDYKGHRQLIAAWPRIVERVPAAELWIAGDGDLRSELERSARVSSAGGSIRFYGHVSEAEKAELLRRCRCLAMPSRNEGFGLVYLEAMRMGRPCLVSTVDAGREVVNPPEAGIAVDPDHVEGISDAVVDLLTPGPSWHQLSARGRARYETFFTAQHFQHRLLAALS